MQAHGEDFCKNAEKSEIFNEKWILRRAVFHEIVLKVRSLGDGPVMVLLLTSLFYVQNFIAMPNPLADDWILNVSGGCCCPHCSS